MHSSIRSRLMALVRAQWAGLLALFLVIAGGTAYAANTIGSGDVINNSLASADLKNNAAVQSQDVRDGTLNDEDIAQAAFVNFPANIGTVPAGACGAFPITGANAQGDHLVLEPSHADMSLPLQYDAVYDPDTETAWIQVCNRTDSTIDDGTTHFNLLVIDAA